jgi:hypothetical protein
VADRFGYQADNQVANVRIGHLAVGLELGRLLQEPQSGPGTVGDRIARQQRQQCPQVGVGDVTRNAGAVAQQLRHRHAAVLRAHLVSPCGKQFGQSRIPAQLVLLDQARDQGRGHGLGQRSHLEYVVALNQVRGTDPPHTAGRRVDLVAIDNDHRQAGYTTGGAKTFHLGAQWFIGKRQRLLRRAAAAACGERAEQTHYHQHSLDPHISPFRKWLTKNPLCLGQP